MTSSFADLRSFKPFWIVGLAAAMALAGCDDDGGTTTADTVAVSDTVADAVADTMADAGADAAADAVADAAADAVADAVADAASDAGADAVADAVADAAADAASDAASDAVADAAADAVADTTPDAIEDTTPDAIEDTTPDAVEDTTPPERTTLLLDFCPSMTNLTPPGYYKGTTAGTNDIQNLACAGPAMGADGQLRVEVAANQTLTAVYTSSKDGVLYFLQSCPVVGSCLAGVDATGEGGTETLSWTNDTGGIVRVTVSLDNDDDPDAFGADGGPFTLDLFVE